MKTVDPYYEWLGIPPKDQPPNHYRLLGLELFEANRDVIDAAANRQMSFIKQYQSGADAELTQKLLNELSAARLCLLSPAAKAAYDDQLRARFKAHSAPETTVPNLPNARWRSESDSPCPASARSAPASQAVSAVPVLGSPRLARKAAPSGVKPLHSTATGRRSKALSRSRAVLGALAAAAVLLAGVLAFVLFLSLRPKPESAKDTPSEGPQEELTAMETPTSSAADLVASPPSDPFSSLPVQEPPQTAEPPPLPTKPPVVTPEVKPSKPPTPVLPVQTPPTAKPEETLEQAEQRLKIAAERASSPAEHRAVAEESLALAKKALANSQPELGKRVAERALAAARQSESGELVRQATLLWSELQ